MEGADDGRTPGQEPLRDVPAAPAGGVRPVSGRLRGSPTDGSGPAGIDGDAVRRPPRRRGPPPLHGGGRRPRVRPGSRALRQPDHGRRAGRAHGRRVHTMEGPRQDRDRAVAEGAPRVRRHRSWARTPVAPPRARGAPCLSASSRGGFSGACAGPADRWATTWSSSSQGAATSRWPTGDATRAPSRRRTAYGAAAVLGAGVARASN